jgi:hypothetical protein
MNNAIIASVFFLTYSFVYRILPKRGAQTTAKMNP